MVETHRPNRMLVTSILIMTGILSYLPTFMVASMLPVIGSSLNVGIEELALILAAQVAGLAVLQVPAGILALRLGSRSTYLLGVFLCGLSYVAVALSRSVVGVQLGVFGGGSGEAIILGTSLSLLSSCYSEGKRGPLVGILWGCSNGIGGTIGLPLGITLALTYGWPVAIGMCGTLLLIFAVFALIVLRNFSVQSPVKRSGKSVGLRIVRSRAIWGLAIGMAGFVELSYVVITFLAQYFHDAHPLWNLSSAGIITGLAIAFTMPGALIGGWLAERGQDRRMILFFASLAFSCLFLTLPFLTPATLWILFAIEGLLAGIGYAVMYLMPSYLRESEGEGVTLGVGIIGTFTFLATGAYEAIFGTLVLAVGYTATWLISSGIAILLLPFLFLVTPNRATKIRDQN